MLPYPVGESYFVSQGACDRGHRGVNRYGNDFDMAVGTLVTAARGGVVSRVESGADEQCDSIAVNYRNTDPNPLGVRSGRYYEALPSD